MRIGINAWFLSNPDTGIGQYTYHLVSHLLRIDPDSEYILICPELPSDAVQSALSGAVFYPTGNPWSALRPSFAKIMWEWRVLSRAANSLNLDVLHSPYTCWTAPGNYRLIMTVLDIALLRFSLRQMGVRALLDKAYFYFLMHRLGHIDHMVSISHSVKKEIADQRYFQAEKITAIHLAPDDRLTRVEDAQAIRQVMAKYEIPTNYVLYIGDRSYRKNIPALLRAYAELPDRVADRYCLVLGGGAGSSEELKQMAAALPGSHRIHFIGFVDRADLAPLYSGAALFVFPSLYEGFGLPPLEAMRCGVPVIASNVSSLPEVVGRAGILVEPSDVSAMCAAMRKVLENDALREQMKMAGLEWSETFTWERTARETHRIYRHH